MILLCLWASMAWAVSVKNVPNPRASNAWVTDMADVIDAKAERELNARLDRLERDLTIEVAVVTVDEVRAPSPKDFATQLFNHWGIGKPGKDNGLLVLLVMGQRRLEMETGYGLEGTLPDSWLGTMQVRQMVPLFKKGKFGEGLTVGVGVIDKRLRAAAAGTLPAGPVRAAPKRTASGRTTSRKTTSKRPAPRETRPRDVIAMTAAGTGGVLLMMLGGVAYNRWYWQQRTCPECETVMLQLDEVADDAHLDAGERTEEAIGSVDYEVRVCRTCDRTATFAHSRWFSGYSRCGRCSYRTLASNSRTIRSATYDHGGLVEVTEDCKHCNHHHTYTRSTPRLERSSSSSSSGGFSSGGGGGGGSFGGGSSGGGGAGSSW